VGISTIEINTETNPIMYLKNTWYVACTPDEINDKPLGRQICGERIAFYRGENNQVAAVEDFCPHRGAALSLGFVENGNLVCGYHGLAMGKPYRCRCSAWVVSRASKVSR